MKQITRGEYYELLRWADDGGAGAEMELYEIRNDRASLERESDENTEASESLAMTSPVNIIG